MMGEALHTGHRTSEIAIPLVFLFLVACHHVGPTDGAGAPDGGSDADSDIDADGDADGDGDSDADGDSDGDADPACPMDSGWPCACDIGTLVCADGSICAELSQPVMGRFCAASCSGEGGECPPTDWEAEGQCLVSDGMESFYCILVCEEEGECPPDQSCVDIGGLLVCLPQWEWD